MITEEVKDLIRHCLVKEDERYTIEQVLEHKWINKNKIFPFFNKTIYDEFEHNFRLYQKMENFEKKIIMFIAMRLSEKEIKKFENLFIALDKDDNGTLSKEEFLEGIKKFGDNKLSQEVKNKIFNKVDTNENKKIDYTEFISSLIGKDIYLNKDKLKEVFDVLDRNKKGSIEKKDVKNILNLEESCINKYENLLEEIGKGKDDEINFDEFFKMICKIFSDNIIKN